MIISRLVSLLWCFQINLSAALFPGRAWLYLALNENSLESYLRLFQENLSLLHKYYVK